MSPKLVRDNIPSIIKQSGKKPIVKLANKEQIIILLKNKLVEEAMEAQQTYSKKNLREEMADVLQVLESLCEELDIEWKMVVEKMHKKAERRGKFEKGYILEDIIEK